MNNKKCSTPHKQRVGLTTPDSPLTLHRTYSGAEQEGYGEMQQQIKYPPGACTEFYFRVVGVDKYLKSRQGWSFPVTRTLCQWQGIVNHIFVSLKTARSWDQFGCYYHFIKLTEGERSITRAQKISLLAC